MGHVGREGKKKKIQKKTPRKNRDHFCFSNRDFLPSFVPAFVLLDAFQHAEHRCPPCFLCQSADDVGAPFQRMLLVPLPWRFATCPEDAFALANSIVTRNAQMRNHQERKIIFIFFFKKGQTLFIFQVT